MSSAAQKPRPASLRAFGPLGVCHSTPYQPKGPNPAGADAGGFFCPSGERILVCWVWRRRLGWRLRGQTSILVAFLWFVGSGAAAVLSARQRRDFGLPCLAAVCGHASLRGDQPSTRRPRRERGLLQRVETVPEAASSLKRKLPCGAPAVAVA